MVLLTGATGFLGKRVQKRLLAQGVKHTATSLSLGVDLRDPAATLKLFERVRPQAVLHCASFAGGIQFGLRQQSQMFRNNLLITLNLLEACREHGVKRLVAPIANCAYPARLRLFREEEFWDGPMHESVMVYGLTRKAQWMGAWAYAREYGLEPIHLVLSNMYGPDDHFDEIRSHALGALAMKLLTAQRENQPSVKVWGTGTPVREWLYVDDGAEAMVRALDVPATTDPINVGVGEGVTIAQLAELVKAEVGYRGELVFDPAYPDGAPFKTMDGTRGEQLLGWRPRMPLREGIRETLRWLRTHRP